MAFFATLADLLKGCPRNIKRRLLRDILLILFVTSGAIGCIVFFQGTKTQRELSSTLITEANRSVRNNFQNFTEPLGNTINLLAKWGESGLLKQDEVELLATQFQALMEIQPAIHAITMADSNGNKIQLTHNDKNWLITEHRKDKLIISKWLDRKIVSSEEQTEKGYLARNSIWYRGAMTTNSQKAYFLSEPYTLETSQELGITASKHWKAFDTPKTDVVTAISFTMSDLMTFMAQFEDTLNDRTLLLEKDGTLLSKFKPGTIQSGSIDSITTPRISNELLKIVTETLAKNVTDKELATSFRYNKKIYWLGLSPLHDDRADIWVAVLIPEDALFNDLQNQWKRFSLIVGSVLILAIMMTVFLVRRYSHQLKDLPQQHVNMHSYEKEIYHLINAGESTSLEFKSTMRTNLKIGKPGKEIELAWLKSVVAFMNSDGGILLIGVADDGEILGLDADNFANEDKCRLHFKNLLNNHIGAEFTRFISLKLLRIQEQTVLLVECERVRQPVFLTVGKNEDFFIRSGPSSTKLTMSQMIKYLNER
jgi:Schlafen, AlbA_2